jgi:hypothetical protein
MSKAVKRDGDDKTVDIVHEPLHFTPSFVNLLRFGPHLSVPAKFPNAKIADFVESAEEEEEPFYHCKSNNRVEWVMESYSLYATFAEETLRQVESFDLTDYDQD